MSKSKINVWDGVYANWESAPTDDRVFTNNIWLDKITDIAEKQLELVTNKKSNSELTISYDYILPVVCSMVEQNDRSLRIIDYGGGLAASYFSLISATSKKIDFHIVETSVVSERGNQLFSEIKDVSFYTRLSEVSHLSSNTDIIHLGSSFQYINDYENLLNELLSFKPKYLVLADVLAGNIKSFVTIQNYYGKRIRVRFHNLDNLISLIEGHGFELLYNNKFTAPILDGVEKLPMDNFNSNHRLEYPCQLLFKSL